MAHKILSVGRPAVTQSLDILTRTHGRPLTVKTGLVLEPGSMGDGDAVLLSAKGRTVEYARGDTLFEDDLYRFLARTYSRDWRRPAWMTTLASPKSDFVFRLAHTLSPWWGP